jgi:chromosome segregation ATPase
MDDINRLDSESVVLKAYKMDTQSQLVAKEKEISSLKQQLAVVHSDLEKEKRVKSNLETRVGQLKQDVVAMTTECHTTHEELRKAVAEKERLNVKEEELTQRILKYEEQLAIKVPFDILYIIIVISCIFMFTCSNLLCILVISCVFLYTC